MHRPNCRQSRQQCWKCRPKILTKRRRMYIPNHNIFYQSFFFWFCWCVWCSTIFVGQFDCIILDWILWCGFRISGQEFGWPHLERGWGTNRYPECVAGQETMSSLMFSFVLNEFILKFQRCKQSTTYDSRIVFSHLDLFLMFFVFLTEGDSFCSIVLFFF